ncbi:hypothetical protein PsorP6_019180 [Peronosclerospora sorghi]|nr:hypothetical protein PsorP6_019180 [Peronosclerospora sorghi]
MFNERSCKSAMAVISPGPDRPTPDLVENLARLPSFELGFEFGRIGPTLALRATKPRAGVLFRLN